MIPPLRLFEIGFHLLRFTLGLYIAGPPLMLHSIGPRRYAEVPLLAAVAYALALWFTLRLARGIARSGRL